MQKIISGKLVRFTPNRQEIERVTLTFDCEVEASDYEALARCYLQPVDITIEGRQGSFGVRRDATGEEQLALDPEPAQAPVVYEERPEVGELPAVSGVSICLRCASIIEPNADGIAPALCPACQNTEEIRSGKKGRRTRTEVA